MQNYKIAIKYVLPNKTKRIGNIFNQHCCIVSLIITEITNESSGRMRHGNKYLIILEYEENKYNKPGVRLEDLLWTVSGKLDVNY